MHNLVVVLPANDVQFAVCSFASFSMSSRPTPCSPIGTWARWWRLRRFVLFIATTMPHFISTTGGSVAKVRRQTVIARAAQSPSSLLIKTDLFLQIPFFFGQCIKSTSTLWHFNHKNFNHGISIESELILGLQHFLDLVRELLLQVIKQISDFKTFVLMGFFCVFINSWIRSWSDNLWVILILRRTTLMKFAMLLIASFVLKARTCSTLGWTWILSFRNLYLAAYASLVMVTCCRMDCVSKMWGKSSFSAFLIST